MHKGRMLAVLLILIGFIYIAYRYTPLVKGNGISIVIESPRAYFSTDKNVVLHVLDKNAGIKSIVVKLISLNTEIELYRKVFKDTFVKDFYVNFKTNRIIPQGRATFLVEVEDYSKNNFLNGFKKVVKLTVTVDSTPPKVILLSGTGRVAIGGTDLAVFYVRDAHLKDVYMGVSHDGVVDKFRAFNAAGIFGNPHVYLSFFTYRLSKLKNYSTNIYALDAAGNLSVVHVPVYYSSWPLVKSRINITDAFIKNKVLAIMEREGVPKKETMIEDFLYVNDAERAKDRRKIKKICSISVDRILWRGKFQQLRGSKVTATFNEKRFYYYKGKLIDIKFHKGYDLASVRNARVNAANNGVVVFEGYLGVYGNAMIIDHGFGIFSLYGHLQSFLVPEGSRVKKGQYIAITDTTGLAGGDHLHFDILVDGYYVNPIEWWDSRWIRTHIYSVLSDAKTRLSLLSH